MTANRNFPQAARAAVYAENMVSTSQPLATQAGLQALANGGNAIDAALSAAITLTVVEPTGNGLGSDAFALLWDGSSLVGLNGSGRAPRAWTPEYFANYQRMPRYGWDSVTVPGAVRAWVDLSERYGRLPFKALFTAAVHYAEAGFAVGPRTAELWQAVAPNYADFADFNHHFGPAPAVGDKIVRADLAESLKAIAASQGEAFYCGELAKQIDRQAKADGGALRLEDLAAHRSEWVEPLTQGYNDYALHELPPNGQGLAALIALGMLSYFDLPPLDSANSVHLQLEAMKIALRAAADHIADPAAMQLSPAALLEPTSLATAAATITDTASALPPLALPTSSDTVYLCAADSDGLMVSFIQSNYYHFGSGIVIPNTGIAMQNRGYGFSLQPGHANQVGPGKLPFHTIIPGFISRDGEPWASFGLMGGPMQAQGHLQMMIRLCGYQQDPQRASDAPRWQILDDYSVALEQGFSTSVADELAQRGHIVQRNVEAAAFGGAQLISKTATGYVAGSDHRKDGLAGGF